MQCSNLPRPPFLSDHLISEPLTDLSESSLDQYIPSYPGSPRSVSYASDISHSSSTEKRNDAIQEAVDFLHSDNELLTAAEIGDHKRIEALLRKGVSVKQMDIVGRTALHMAVAAGDEKSIRLLLYAGAETNIKDSLGMTPLSICLMRRPSLKIAKLLFQHGALLLPRMSPMDTGLFLQFVMMCTPTQEEIGLIKLLADMGGLVDDPDAPGDRQALHFAAMSNNCVLIQVLYDLGADLFLTNHRNETPKEVAISFRCREAMLLLEQLEERETSKEKESDLSESKD